MSVRLASKTVRSVGRPADVELQERRRGQILDAATSVFATQGFATADVQEIANKTGVGKGTIYRYFASKEELFLAAVDHGMRNLKLAVDAAAASAKQPLDRIAEGVLAYLTFFDFIN
jgi:AcrR family transcriptional regulator